MRYTIGFCWVFYILFSSGLHAQTFQLKTENYPPFNLGDSDGEIIGISSEIVKTLFKRADVKYEMELLPWQRAYRLALEEADHAVFSTTQTTERQIQMGMGAFFVRLPNPRPPNPSLQTTS